MEWLSYFGAWFAVVFIFVCGYQFTRLIMYFVKIIKMEINDRKKLVFPEYQPSPVMSLNPDTITEPVTLTGEYNDFKPKKIIMAHSFYKRNGVHFGDDPTEIEQRILLPGPEYPWYGGPRTRHVPIHPGPGVRETPTSFRVRDFNI